MKKALLTVSFGTSYRDTLEKNIAMIEKDLAAALPERDAFRAFTSGKIMKKLRERDGLHIFNVTEALEHLLAQGYEDVLIQPTHILNGEEYDKLCSMALPYAEKFGKFRFGAPMLTDIEDYRELADAVLPTLPEKKPGCAIALMGHGSGHHANAVYSMIDYLFRDRGREDVCIGTVEGYPGLEEVRRRLSELKVQKVLLQPLMIVAGDHATNDLAGDGPDSWKSVLEGDGYETECVLKGLGENPAARQIYVRHALRADRD